MQIGKRDIVILIPQRIVTDLKGLTGSIFSIHLVI